MDVEGFQVVSKGLDDPLKNNDFEIAFREICSKNYVPKDLKYKLRTAKKKEFEKIH